MNLKKFCAVFTVSILFISNIMNAYANVPDFHVLTDEEKRLNADAVTAYSSIIDSFDTDETGEIIYDENYAGAYINDDGYLVELIPAEEDALLKQRAIGKSESNILSAVFDTDESIFKNKNEKFKDAVFEFEATAETTDSNTIVFQEAKYSYTYLSKLMNQLNEDYAEKAFNPDSIWSQVAGMALLDDLNCIRVEILDIDDNKIEAFKSEAYSSEAITFENAEELSSILPSEPESSVEFEAPEDIDDTLTLNRAANYKMIYPGQGYRTRRTDFPDRFRDNSSVGFGVKSYDATGDIRGFITAGHSVTEGEEVFDANNDLMGICIALVINEKADAAYVAIADDYSVSNLTHTRSDILSKNSSASKTRLVVGALLYKDGYQTGLTTGTITSVNASAQFKDYPVISTDLLQTGSAIGAIGGDSGSIAYVYNPSTADFSTAGILQGGDNDFYFVKASNAMLELEDALFDFGISMGRDK